MPVEKTENVQSMFITQGRYRYEILAAVTLIPGSDPVPHAGEWETIVTICRTSDNEPPRAQAFPNAPDMARRKMKQEARARSMA